MPRVAHASGASASSQSDGDCGEQPEGGQRAGRNERGRGERAPAAVATHNGDGSVNKWDVSKWGGRGHGSERFMAE
jgi:hypothetical protein